LGAVKVIKGYLGLAQKHGTDIRTLRAGYAAAAAARGTSRHPFLVTSRGDLALSGTTLTVRSGPLGYHRQVETEQVSE
jgi:hypothetical protein